MKEVGLVRKSTVGGLACTIVFGLMLSVTQAGFITADSATGTGSYQNSPSLIIDGVFAHESDSWTSSTNVYWENTTDSAFIIDLGGVYSVDDVVLSVDNDDSYQVEYSIDNMTWQTLFTISSDYGDISPSDGGMDAMSTIAGDTEYVSGIDFTSVVAQYLRIFAINGDQKYAVSELRAYGMSVPVPGAAILAMMGLVASATFCRRTRLPGK